MYCIWGLRCVLRSVGKVPRCRLTASCLSLGMCIQRPGGNVFWRCGGTGLLPSNEIFQLRWSLLCISRSFWGLLASCATPHWQLALGSLRVLYVLVLWTSKPTRYLAFSRVQNCSAWWDLSSCLLLFRSAFQRKVGARDSDWRRSGRVPIDAPRQEAKVCTGSHIVTKVVVDFVE